MKKNEIEVGGHYQAKVSGNLVTVRVDEIGKRTSTDSSRKGGTYYECTNLKTGRKVNFRSAQKFRQRAVVPTYHEKNRVFAQVSEDEQPTFSKKQDKLADKIRNRKDLGTDTAPHLIVEARAGTGKTSTLVEGLKRVKGLDSPLTPSPQQAAVWEAMEQSKGKAQSICFVAFNKAIATELQRRVPEGCDAMTMHSMGFKAVCRTFDLTFKDINKYRGQDIISEVMGRDIRELRRYKAEVIKAVEKLVGLCKMNLVDPNAPTQSKEMEHQRQALWDLASHYDIDLNGNAQEVFDLVPKVLERCKDVSKDRCLDFADMIWLPVVLDLNVYKYDLLLVDEAQDLNRCQQQLALKAGRRLILCGDPKQSIYGFAGADSESMQRMEETLSTTQRGCEHLPLTVTRRCGKAIVAEAQKVVPDFEAFEANASGTISRATYTKSETICVDTLENGNTEDRVVGVTSYHDLAKDGDMCLCRVNAPLVSQCFKFLKAGRKAQIQGRDVGQGLISTIKKLKATDVADLLGKLSDWQAQETRKETAKRNPNDTRLIAIQDRYECLQCFCEDQETVDDVIRKIESVFTDDKDNPGVKFSSIHKAKGLEANRVFFLEPEGASCPHPMAKSKWQKEQEMHLRYVAITRAITELVYVS